ncbi:MAG: MBL fold metallo-hydrolase [Candidatus Aenigmatarchaeota archaeon]
MFIKLLGGACEVGKSGILINSNSTNFILDYGVKIQPEPPQYPIIPKRVDGIILTHSHLDHSGAIPILPNTPVYMTGVSSELFELLIRDFMKVAKYRGYPIKFSKDDFKQVMKNIRIVDYEKSFFINNIYCKLFDAGHIPGSASIFMRAEGKNILYTGDIKLKSQRLVNGCILPKEEIDVLIIESTYGDRDHPDRLKQEEKFKSEIDETINQHGVVIVPTFAVGRAQEILLILKDYVNYIALDGMTKDASKIILNNKKYIKNYDELTRIFRKIKKIKNNKERAKLLKKPNIIITTSGMLNGGPVVYYIKKIYNRKDAKILMTGFQIDGTPGKTLLDTGVFMNEDIKLPVRCPVKRFDFSSHAGRSELFDIIKKLNPRQVICVHGDNCDDFAKYIENDLMIPATAPRNGDKIEI